jgi:hypothetical protein
LQSAKRVLFAWGLLAFAPGVFADYRDNTGYTKLQAELGGSMLTGSGVGVSQVEAPSDAAGNYLPDRTLAEFTGKTFTIKSGTATGVSSHATTVAQYDYGNATSMSPGVTAIDLYEANTWLQAGYLHYGFNSVPLTETRAFQNHSWASSVDNGPVDTEIIRRIDYAMQRDNFLAVVGLYNNAGVGTPTIPSLLASCYNGISVGLTNGNHQTGTTPVDGSGRMKPELVAPELYTSFAVPQVSSACALLVQEARSSSPLASATNGVVIKAALMAGATKNQFTSWSRTPTQPLDTVFGAGQVNVYYSYHIISAGKQTSSASSVVRPRGWDYAQTASGGASRLYFFDIAPGNTAPGFSAILTWNRVISHSNPNTWNSTFTNLQLNLFAASGFTTGSLVDSSSSTLDNVQHIYQPNLPPGRYALQVTSGSSGINYALAWNSLPAVSASATTPDAYKFGPVTGGITVTRAGDTTDPLAVNYIVAGTASPGGDYTAISGSVTIPSGTNATTIAILPISNQTPVGDLTVTVTLSTDPAYAVGSSGAATVTIHDTPYNQWLLNYFTQADLGNPAVSGPSADPDRDGISNLMEYALNLKPKSPDIAGLPSVSISNGALTLSYTQVKSATDITYTPEVSTDLVSWHSGPGYTSVIQTSDHGTTQTVTVASQLSPNSSPRQFIRLRINGN